MSDEAMAMLAQTSHELGSAREESARLRRALDETVKNADAVIENLRAQKDASDELLGKVGVMLLAANARADAAFALLREARGFVSALGLPSTREKSFMERCDAILKGDCDA